MVRDTYDMEAALTTEALAALGDPVYRNAFFSIMANPNMAHFTLDSGEQAAVRRVLNVQRMIGFDRAAMTVNDGSSSGGLLAPIAIDPNINYTGDGAANPLRDLCRVDTTVAPVKRYVTSAGTTVAFAAEGAEVADNSPTLGSVEIRPERLHGFVIASWELSMDVGQLEEQVANLFALDRAEVEADKYLKGAGTGSDEPLGLITALDGTTSEIAPTTAESFAFPDVSKLVKAVPPRYRNANNAAWILNWDTYYAISQFVAAADTSNAPIVSDDGSRILGRPWFEASGMDSSDDIDAGATADNFVAVFGDLRGYVILDRLGTLIGMHSIQHMFGDNQRPTGQQGFYYFARTSGGLVNSNAVRVLSIPTAA